MVPLGRFASLGARTLARLTHYGERTARRWIRDGLAPRAVVHCLQLLYDGDLGVINNAWAGWCINARDGLLYTPERVGRGYNPNEIRALPLWHQRMSCLERDLELLQEAARRAGTQRQSDFADRVQQLAAMAASLAAEIAPPSSDSATLAPTESSVPAARRQTPTLRHG